MKIKKKNLILNDKKLINLKTLTFQIGKIGDKNTDCETIA